MSRRQVDHSPLTQARLKEFLHYNPKTGCFTWIKVKSRKGASLLGKRAGTIRHDGYRMIGIDYVQYLDHRLAWLYMKGEWESAREIDHRDRDTTNNAWSNLRRATRAQNVINRDVVRNNTTGATGVSRCGNGYRAYITVDGKTMHLGCARTVAEAAKLRRQAAVKYFGEFAEAA